MSLMQANNITVSYGGKQVLDRVNLSIMPGEMSQSLAPMGQENQRFCVC